MRLQLLLLGSAAILFAAGDAKASDLYTPSPEVVAPVGTYNWTGIYAGVLGGWNGSRVRGRWNFLGQLKDPSPDFALKASGGTDFRSSGEGGLVGGTVGANLQRGMFVFGAEGDFASINKSSRGTDNFTDFVSLTFGNQTGSLEIPGDLTHRWHMNWFGTGRFRAGITPVDRLLIFGTAGVAVANANLETIARVGGEAPTTSNENTYCGWTGGAGGEFAIAPHVRLKADWLYYDLGSEEDRTRSVLQVQPGDVYLPSALSWTSPATRSGAVSSSPSDTC
jgi:outer membrane immunogenic protein